MEADGSSRGTRKSDPTDEQQSRRYRELRRTSSSGSLIGKLSSSLFGETVAQFNEGLECEHVYHLEDGAENGGGSSLVRRSHSLEYTRNTGGSFRRLFSFSSAYCSPIDEDLENEIVSEAGDNGGRSLSTKGSQRESDHSIKNEVAFPVPKEPLKSFGFWKHDNSNSRENCLISPLVEDVMTSLPTGASLQKELEEKKEQPVLEYVSCLVHLAVFGILGVFSRYLLQKLFGPNVLGVTRDQEILYLDLPSNMVGSFLMGWFGVVFKADISHVSDQLAIGLSTGYLGSLTTFSSWNQKMVELSVNGRWASAVSGVIIGLFLCAFSINLGVETAKGFKKVLEKTRNCSTSSTSTPNSKKQHLMVLLLLSSVWASLLATSGVLAHKTFEDGGSVAHLWLGVLVAPLGVWIRWWLASLNGRGIGREGRYKWIPFGTLTANVLAAAVMAALATLKKAVNTKKCETIATGVQFGLLGCLSTVSTFMAEYNAMRNSSRTRRAHAYAAITFGFSFVSAIFIFSVPVWTQGYN